MSPSEENCPSTGSPALRSAFVVAVLLSVFGCAWAPAPVQHPIVVRAQSSRTDQSAEDVDAPPGTPVLVLSLRDAVELALENSDVVLVLEGRVRLSSQSVYDSMIASWEAAAEEGVFQPSISARAEGSRIDEPPNSFFGPGIAANTRRDTLDLNLRLTQPLKTGGELSMGIEPPLAYLYFPAGVDPDEFNPTWSADYVFRFRQPLMRGHGRRVATAPIRIARLRTSQSQWSLQEELNALIRSVIDAYWNLYAGYVEQQAIEAVIPLAKESVRIERLRFEAEQTIYADVARAEYQLEALRADVIRARADVRRRTLQLRQLIGGPSQMLPMLYPGDIPIQTPPAQHADGLIDTAVMRRPELNRIRDVVHQREVELDVAKNGELPQFDFKADYRGGGLTERLDTALGQADSFDYADWTLGVDVNVPLGNLTARSRRHAAELQLARERARLQRQEQNVAFQVVELHSDQQAAWQSFVVTTRQASQTQEWLRLSRLRYAEPPAAASGRNWLLLELSDFQTAMRSWVDAVTSSGSAIARFNIMAARLDEATGAAVQNWTAMSIDPGSAPDGRLSAPVSLSLRYGHTLPVRSTVSPDSDPQKFAAPFGHAVNMTRYR